MENFATQFKDLELVPMGIRLFWNNTTNKKGIVFKPAWERATLGTYRSFFHADDNGIALVTGEASDIIVIDVDVLKEPERGSVQDGMVFWRDKIKEHGLPEKTPIQKTASGGMHYFFSLSKSIEKGLDSAKNAAKIKVDGMLTSIDVRADNGCIIVAPSQVNGSKYKFVAPLVPREEMPAMPDWCIDLLNKSTKKPKHVSRDTCRFISALASSFDDDQKASVFFNGVKKVLEEFLGTKIGKWSARRGGFDFRPRSIVECFLCGELHGSNNYKTRQVLEDCFTICNYSENCSSNAFNWEEHPSIKDLLCFPNTDQPYSAILAAHFRSKGFLLVHAYDLKKDQGRFMCFNGRVWQELSRHRLFDEIPDTCGTIITSLLIHIKPQRGADDEEKERIEKQKKQLARGLAYVKKKTNIGNILGYFTGTNTDEVLESRLDKNPDILVVANGTIDLDTGELREGRPSDYMSRQLDIEYLGLDADTGLIDGFIGDLFNNDLDGVAFLQRLLGYGITGRTDSQIWAMLTGEGSNGKSLLASMLKSVLGEWMTTAPHEIFFKGNRGNDGTHTTYLAPLKSSRICIKEEAEPTEKLNTEILKMITGGGEISMRAAYAREYDEFECMALPILLCNQRPAVDVDDNAMMRRIVVIPFHNIYTTPDDPKRPFDTNNPRHRLRDSDLKKKLLDERAREQFLVWLVRGTVAWYKNKDFSSQPPLVRDAYMQYNDENDKLQQFITEFCEINPSYHVNAKSFRDELSNYGMPIMQIKLAKLMKDRGFPAASPRINGRQEKTYRGLRLVETS